MLMSKNVSFSLAFGLFRVFPYCWNFITTLGGSPGRTFVLCFTLQLSNLELKANEGWNQTLIVRCLTLGLNSHVNISVTFML